MQSLQHITHEIYKLKHNALKQFDVSHHKHNNVAMTFERRLARSDAYQPLQVVYNSIKGEA